MNAALVDYEIDPEVFSHKLKWLISLRFVFAVLLLGSTVAYHIGDSSDILEKPVIFLYGLSGTILLLTIVYGYWLPSIKRNGYLFVHGQIGIDAFCVTLIIYITGGSASLFLFLYLVVVIYSSVFTGKYGTLWVATFCSVQFAVLLVCELNHFINPFGYASGIANASLTGAQVFQKSAILAGGCFSVALLSGYLSDQERQSKTELAAMETHLSRVQNLAQIGEMAAGLAHEIKNPLASLSGAIQILKGEMEQADSDNMRLMNIVLRETDRLGNLVNNFLVFARPSAAQARCVGLTDILTEVVTLFEKDNAVRERIQLSLALSVDAFVFFDPLQLKQVFWNLLSNAADAIEENGKIDIDVRLLKNEKVLVEIVDNGCGMDKQTIKSIFNPFFTTKDGGTGLGLSIVYRILETHDCRLDVHSEPGAGSTFALYFKKVDPHNGLLDGFSDSRRTQ